MMKKRIVMGVALTLLSSSALSAESVEKRVERMERLLEGKALLQMMERLDALQMEVQQLRGQLEEQQHQMNGMKSRQRELYLDVDRRMLRLEREGGGGAAPLAPADETPLTSAPLSPANNTAKSAATQQAATDTQPQLEQERAAYQEAFELLRELRYEQATTAFRQFLQRYPDGRYAHIAQYWLGEAAYARRDFNQAIQDYQALLNNHPRSAKRAEAMLKIGYSYQELKQYAKAEAVLKRLIELYPDSTEAGQARNQLKRLKNRGG